MCLPSSLLYFNSRLRTGGDIMRHSKDCCLIQFQLTPPHGRRPHGTHTRARNPRISTHASAREATMQSGDRAAGASKISTHASAREATFGIRSLSHRAAYFNSRLRTGGDCVPISTLTRFIDISTHASAREATIDYA